MKESSIIALQSSLISKERRKHHTSFIGFGVKLAIPANIFSASNPCEGLGSKCSLKITKNEENCFVFSLKFYCFLEAQTILCWTKHKGGKWGEIWEIKWNKRVSRRLSHSSSKNHLILAKDVCFPLLWQKAYTIEGLCAPARTLHFKKESEQCQKRRWSSDPQLMWVFFSCRNFN